VQASRPVAAFRLPEFSVAPVLFCKFTEYITSRDALPKGKVNVRYEFAADKPGEFISTECTWSA
jgi:hypothetical protein